MQLPSPKTAQSSLILIIEDDIFIQRLLTKQLQHHGFQTICQESGELGLRWLGENQADLVLLDMMLPDMNGVETCRRIRKQHNANVLPVLMLSALGHDANGRRNGIQAGANDYMGKPYSQDELVARVRSLLERKREAQHAELLLSRYVSPMLRRESALNPTMLNRAERGQAVVLFADLRGFTALSSQLPLEELFDVLNDFFAVAMTVIEEYGGVVFDVIGDQLLAVFNLPTPVPVAAHLAAQAGLKMQSMFEDLRESWNRSGFQVGLGIGIHEGEVIVGNLGSQHLMRYTVIGSPVNIANRLLGLAHDGDVIVSEEVYKQLRLPENITCEILNDVVLKGVTAQQTVYRLRMPLLVDVSIASGEQLPEQL
jgi:adenylate cyclase